MTAAPQATRRTGGTDRAPAFSVIVPCYNVAGCVREALDCLSRQTFRDFEVVAVDDGSTDDTRSILENYPANFPFIVLTQPNRGLGGARNTAIREARGEFLAFLDADDLWEPAKLGRVHDTLVGTHSDLVCHDEYVRQDGRVRQTNRYGPHVRYADLLFEGNCLSPSAVTVRRAHVLAAGLFSEDRAIHGVEDYDLWMRLAHAGTRFAYLHEPLGTYVLHGSNMSSETDFLDREGIVLQRHFAAIDSRDPAIAKRMRKRRAVYYACKGWGLYRQGRFGEALRWYARAARTDPTCRKLYKYVVAGPFWWLWQSRYARTAAP